MEYARTVGAVMVDAGRRNGYLSDHLATMEDLAEVEKSIFIGMFKALDAHLKKACEAELTLDEISSMFTYTYAKAAEAVANSVNHQEQKFDTLGLFDGKIPICSDDRLIEYFKQLGADAKLGAAFVDWADEHRSDADFHAVLALMEALKWEFRISVHLAITFAEANPPSDCGFPDASRR